MNRKARKMKLNSTGRHEEVLRTGRSLRWAAVLVVATVGTGLRTAHAGINQWTSLGPYGGAIKTLVIDPQNTSTMYAGTWAGLFKTIDGAASWMPASTGLRILPASGLAIDPQNTSTLYAWSAGSELFKSTDGAASWNAMRLPLPFAVWAVALAPGGVIYVGGETYIENQIYGSPPYPYGAVLKSLDGGATWSTLRLPDHLRAQTLTIDPQSPNTVFVSGDAVCWTGDPCDPADVYWGVLKTTDGGASWIEGARLVPMILVLDPGTPNTLFGGTPGGGIYKSTDGGANWNAANSGIPDGFRNTLALAIDPRSPGTLYAVMGSVSSGSIFKSTDGGATWSEVNSVAAGSSKYPHVSRPGGADRQGIDPFSFDTTIDGDFGPLGVGLAFDPSSPGTVYVGTNGDGVFKSTNGGTNWRAANAGLTAMPVNQVALDPQHPGTMYTVGWTRFFKSEDGGLTWRGGNWGAPALFTSTFAVDPQSPSTIYAGQQNVDFLDFSGGAFKSTDGGMNWRFMKLRGLHVGVRCDVMDLVFDPQNPNTLYAGSYWCGLTKPQIRAKPGTYWISCPAGRGT